METPAAHAGFITLQVQLGERMRIASGQKLAIVNSRLYLFVEGNIFILDLKKKSDMKHEFKCIKEHDETLGPVEQVYANDYYDVTDCFAANDSKVYMFTDQRMTYDEVFSYDPRTNTSIYPGVPIGVPRTTSQNLRSGLTSVQDASTGLIYMYGGDSYDPVRDHTLDQYSRDMHVFNAALRQWTKLPIEMVPEIDESFSHNSCVHKGKLYIFSLDYPIGDWDSPPEKQEAEERRHLAFVPKELDISTGVWRNLPALPTTVRKNAAVVVHEDNIYIVGGTSYAASFYVQPRDAASLQRRNVFESGVDVYSTVTETWSILPSRLKNGGRRDHSAFIHDGQLYVIGGYKTIYLEGESRSHLTIEVVALAPQLFWSQSTHHRYSVKFRRAIHTMVLCFARTKALNPDALEVIFKLLKHNHFDVAPSQLSFMIENGCLRAEVAELKKQQAEMIT